MLSVFHCDTHEMQCQATALMMAVFEEWGANFTLVHSVSWSVLC